ncbi:mucin-2 isoform X3 [Patella vulgata]|nr:mucin-2 isoform X3 [Patella vulgata]
MEHTVKKLPVDWKTNETSQHEGDDEVFAVEAKTTLPPQCQDNRYLENGSDEITARHEKQLEANLEPGQVQIISAMDINKPSGGHINKKKTRKPKGSHSSDSSSSSSSSDDEEKKRNIKNSSTPKDENVLINGDADSTKKKRKNSSSDDKRRSSDQGPSPPPRKSKLNKTDNHEVELPLNIDSIKLPQVNKDRHSTTSSSSNSDTEKNKQNKNITTPKPNSDLRLDVSKNKDDSPDETGPKAGDFLDFSISTSDSPPVYSTPRGPCNKIRSVSSYSSSSEDEHKTPYKISGGVPKSPKSNENKQEISSSPQRLDLNPIESPTKNVALAPENPTKDDTDKAIIPALDKSVSSTDSVSSENITSYNIHTESESDPDKKSTKNKNPVLKSPEITNCQPKLPEISHKISPSQPTAETRHPNKKDIGTQVSVDGARSKTPETPKDKSSKSITASKNKSPSNSTKKTKNSTTSNSSSSSSSSDSETGDSKNDKKIKTSKNKRKSKRTDSSGGIRAKLGELFKRKEKKPKMEKEKKKSTTDEDNKEGKVDIPTPKVCTPEQVYDELIVKKAPGVGASVNVPDVNHCHKKTSTPSRPSADINIATPSLPPKINNGGVTVTAPSLTLGNTGDVKINTPSPPSVDLPKLKGGVDINPPSVNVPGDIKIGTPSPPSVDLPKLKGDVDINPSSVNVPKLNTGNINIKTPSLPSVDIPNVKTGDINVAGLECHSVDVPSIPTGRVNIGKPKVVPADLQEINVNVTSPCNAEFKDKSPKGDGNNDKLNTSSSSSDSSSSHKSSSSNSSRNPTQNNSIIIEENPNQQALDNSPKDAIIDQINHATSSPLCVSPSLTTRTPVKEEISTPLKHPTTDTINSSHQQYYTDGHHFVVVAIDFGTTFSGYAFSFVRDPDNILMMRKWEGGDPGVVNQKTPTIILLDPNGKFNSFGFTARDTYNDLDPKEAASWLYFDKFKMVLHHQSELTKDTMVAASNGKLFPAINIFAYALKFLKDHALQELTDQSGFQIINEDIRWVITVPAIWKAPAKQFMRQAAYNAGLVSSDSPDKLLIALEPEAASIYCRKLKMHQLIPEYPIQRPLQSPKHSHPEEIDDNPACTNVHIDVSPTEYSFPLQLSPNQTLDSSMRGTRYMVVDCGGGTVDITVHELSLAGKLIELHKATGGPHGATGVDLEFEKLLGCIFGPEFITQYKQRYPVGWVNLMTNFESRKRSANPAKPTSSNVSLPFSFIDYHKKHKGKQVEVMVKKHGDHDVRWSAQGMLRLSPEAMKLLFAPTLDKIKQAIGDIINHPHCRRLKYMFLVGGFAESPILQHEIRKEFDSDKNHIVKVLIPQAVSLAILKGAVMFGLDPMVVNVRRSRVTYGIGVLNRFDPEKHPESKLVTRDGKDWCTDVFEKFVCTDEAVALGDVVVKSYTPAVSGQTKSIINMYCSENEHVQFITDQGVRKCGTLTLDLSQYEIQESAYRREIQIRMCFGDTEIKVSAQDITTGQVVRSIIDFLNK